jgi:hypothetical protein
MPVTLKPDPFSATLLESPPLDVSLEQQHYIRKILDIACSDSKFAEKAYTAIWRVLTGGNVTPPKVTSLNPSSIVLGSPSFPLRVVGTGFTPTSVIVFNGGEEPTLYLSSTELTTGVDMSTATTAITVGVAVLNEDGVLSDPVNFEFKDATVAATKEPVKHEPVPIKHTPVGK